MDNFLRNASHPRITQLRKVKVEEFRARQGQVGNDREPGGAAEREWIQPKWTKNIKTIQRRIAKSGGSIWSTSCKPDTGLQANRHARKRTRGCNSSTGT
jgi:hypothetical protein